jgi:hypothetical protein
MREPFVDYVQRELPDAAVLIACGLPATNKTETTEVVARLKGWPMLRTDIIRREVLAGEDIFDAKVAGDMTRRQRVYDEMFRRADEQAARGEGVILDATFVKQALRRRAAEVAARRDLPFVIQQTSCSEGYSLAKIAARTRENYESNALTAEAYHNNVRKFEAVDLDALRTEFPSLRILHLVVETESDDPESWFVVGRTAI